MKMIAEYLEHAIQFERMTAGATDPALKASLSKQAHAYRKLAEERLQLPKSPQPTEALPWSLRGTQYGPRTLRRAMATPTIIVRASPPTGFRWRVIIDGETVGTGTAATEFKARTAANEVVKRIETKPPEAP